MFVYFIRAETNRSKSWDVHSHMFWFSITLNLLGILCEDDSIYGIIIAKYLDQISATCYKFTPSDSQTSTKSNLTYKTFGCKGRDISICVDSIKGTAGFQDIPLNQIFLKIFYFSQLYDHYNNKATELQTMINADNKLAENYLDLKSVSQVTELFTLQIYHLLLFALININIGNQELRKTTTIIFRNKYLFISFFTPNTNSLPPIITYNIKYKAQDYTVAVNSFPCASPLEVSYNIYKKLILKSTSAKYIVHPCIPTNRRVKFNPNEVKSECVKNFGITTSVTFTGLFNEEECQTLIHHTVTRNKNSCIHRTRNFAEMCLPLQFNSNNGLILYTTLITGRKKTILIDESLKKIQKKACAPVNKLLMRITSDEKCFQALYLKYLITQIMGFKGDTVVLNNDDYPELSFEKMIFADPRIGLFVYAKTSFISTTSEISTTERSIPETATSKTTTAEQTATIETISSISIVQVTTSKTAGLSTETKTAIAITISLLIIFTGTAISIFVYFKWNQSLEYNL